MRLLRRCILMLVALAGCRADPTPATPAAPAADWFVDRAADAGLLFTHVNGMSGALYDAEIFAPGVALFDYDNDGDLDVYFTQGQKLGTRNTAPPQSDRLYRNDLSISADGRRILRFTDVTAQSGINVTSYGMGVAAGDIDNDGWVDLYLTRLDRNVMLHNNGNGTFTDMSRRSGTDDPAWSVSAAFVDIDRDGWLDLYVGNYLKYNTAADEACTTVSGQPDYCPPAAYPIAPDHLYRNRGDGTFVDITARAGIADTTGAALGVATADYNGDGWMDIYVANDSSENFLWINQHDGTFTNGALLAGVALDADGDAESSMGVDAGDFDNDGDEDLFIANLTGEGDTLYGNDGMGRFEDWGVRSGLRPASLPFTGFGAAWFDADNDGWLDLLVANGAVRIIEAQARQRDPLPLRQRPQFFRNLGNGRFEDATARGGSAFRTPLVGRGAAFGDIDNDGDIDIVVANNNGPAQLFVNEPPQRNHWVGLRLAGTAAMRDMLGARVAVSIGTHMYWRRARSDGSYASANDPRALVGVGASTGPARVHVAWPDGGGEVFDNVPADAWTTLRQGTGKPWDPAGKTL